MPFTNNTSMLSDGNSIAIRLFYKNPYAESEFDKYAEEEQTYTYDELYGAQCVEITCGLKSSGLVNITYINGLLIIRTEADVDILLSGHSPACGIHIETKGGCGIVGGPDLTLPVGLYVKAKRIVANLPISSQGFISLISDPDPAEGMIDISRPISADKLLINTPNFLIKSKLVANSGGISCKTLKVTPEGKIQLKSNSIKPINFDDLDPDYAEFRSVYLIWKKQVEAEVFNNQKSFLIADKLIYAGGLNLENAIMQIKETIHFVPGCTVELNNVSTSGVGLQLDKGSTISGSDTSFKLQEQFDINGNCNIDGLTVYCNSASASGLLWGGKSLLLDIKDTGSFHGIVGAKQTIIKYKYLLATAVLGNEGLYHETFVNGGIIGTSSLTMDGLACVRTGGAYLYGPTIFLNNGNDVGLFSYIRTFNLVKNCLYEYCKLEGVVPCKPEHMSDLMNPNKLLRVTEMIGSNFPGLRGFVSFLNIGKMIGSGCLTALTSTFTALRDDPNILRQLSNLGQAGMASVTAVAKSAQYGAESIVNLAMGEWNSDRVKEFVDILLQANGLRIYAQTIVSQATGALIFVNDVQNLTYTNPDFTFENIKSAASKFTVADALDATKNVGDNIAEAVGAKLKEAKNIIETPGSRAKFINDNFTVLKKSAHSSNKQPEDAGSDEQQPIDTPVQTVTEPTDERITLAQAAKDVVLNQVSEILNAPAKIFNRVVGAVDAIQSISPAETASQLFTSTNEKVDAFMTAAKAVRNAEPTPFAIHAPTINEDFLWAMTKESAKLLSPSVYCNSFVSDTGGFMLTGNYIVNTGFYRNSGMVMALGTSVHALYDSSNYGTIFSQRHTETARNRNNYGILSAAEANIYVRDNNEYGVTEASTRMVFDIKNHYVAKGAKFRSTGQTYGNVTGSFVSDGGTDLRNGFLNVAGKVEYNESSDAKAHNLEMTYSSDVTRAGKEDFDNCPLSIAGNNVTTSTGKFEHRKVNEVIAGNSSDCAKQNKTAGTRTIDGHTTYEETSVLNATDVDFNYNGGLARNGQETVTGGSIFIQGKEENALPSTTYHDAVPQITIGDLTADGVLTIANLHKEVGGKSTLGVDSDTVAVGVVLDSKQGCELNGTAELERVMLNGNEKIKLSDTSTTDTKNVHFIADNFEHEGNLEYEETLQITAKHADLTLGSTVRKSGATSSFGLNTGTLTMPLAAHHENIFVVLTNESSEKSRNLAIGLNDAQHMIVDANIIVRTNDATPVEYAGLRADGAHATLITAGPVILPPQYDRAKNINFPLYSLAGAFIKYDYMYHNLPPELKKKYSTFKKCKKWTEKHILKPVAKVIDKTGGYVATIVTCIGEPVAGFLIGTVTVGTQVIRNDHAKKKIDRLEQETLQNLHNQRIMELGLLSDEERAAHAANSEAQHYAKLNAWQQSVLSQTNGDADMSVISEAFAANQALVSNEYANAKNQLNEAYDSYTTEIKKNNSIIKELIDRRSGKVGIGTSVNAGSSGFNVNVTSQLYTPQGQPINVSYPVYNRDFSNPTYEQPPNTPQHPREEPKVKSERDLAAEDQVHELPRPVSTYEPMSVTTNDQGSTVFSRQVTEPQNNTSAWLHLYNKERAPIHAAINQLYANEFLTSPGLQYVSPVTLTPTTKYDWYDTTWLEDSSDLKPNLGFLAAKFATGVAGGMAINGAIFKASSIKYIGSFIRGAGWLGAGVMVAEAFGVAAEFERDNFIYTEEYEHIVNNPLISEERKDQLFDESVKRQAQARKEAESLKGISTKFKENPIIFGFGVGSFLTFEQLAGATFASNAFMNLRIRFPFKSVAKDRHIEYLNKVVKSPPGIEYIELATGGANVFENFSKARTMAAIRANLGEDAVPYLSTIGPHKNNVYVGTQSRDKKSLWRLDWDESKGAHINWKFAPGSNPNEHYSGAIQIDRMRYDDYLQIIEKFPRRYKFIGRD